MGLIIKGLHIEEILINIEDEEEQAEPLQEEPAEQEPVKKAPRKRSKPIDKGKIGALRKAGWSVLKIADEMRCDQSTVYRVIRELGL